MLMTTRTKFYKVILYNSIKKYKMNRNVGFFLIIQKKWRPLWRKIIKLWFKTLKEALDKVGFYGIDKVGFYVLEITQNHEDVNNSQISL